MKIKITLFFTLLITVTGGYSQTKLRTNTLGWAAGLVNLGVETALSKHMTALVEGYYSPIWDGKDFAAKGFLVTPEVRYYLCEKFNKHYFGIHANYTDYSRLKPGRGLHIRDGYGYGVGITYGHAWIFNHSWSFDLFGGFGWWQLKNDVYSRCEPDFMIEKGAVENLFGITRLGASFAYRF